MKCEHCGKNEATFFFHSSVNGKVEERRLCASCAEKTGLARHMAAGSRSMWGNLMGRSLFDIFGGGEAFGRPEGLFASSLMGRMLDNPFDDFFDSMPALGASLSPAERTEEGQEAGTEEAPAENPFARARRLNALRLELRRAVEQEEYERAAQLRDEIRDMEADGAPEV